MKLNRLVHVRFFNLSKRNLCLSMEVKRAGILAISVLF